MKPQTLNWPMSMPQWARQRFLHSWTNEYDRRRRQPQSSPHHYLHHRHHTCLDLRHRHRLQGPHPKRMAPCSSRRKRLVKMCFDIMLTRIVLTLPHVLVVKIPINLKLGSALCGAWQSSIRAFLHSIIVIISTISHRHTIIAYYSYTSMCACTPSHPLERDSNVAYTYISRQISRIMNIHPEGRASYSYTPLCT